MNAPEGQEGTSPRAAPPIGRHIARAGLSLAWERLWTAAWPLTATVAVFTVAALLDVLPHLPWWLHTAALAAFAAAAAWGALRVVRAARWPSRRDAVRRVERASGLDHRPIDAVEDSLAGHDPGEATRALWRAHQRRMADRLSGLRAGMPEPGLPARDPWAARLALAAMLVVGLVVAGPETGQRLGRSLAPSVGLGGGGAEARLEIWITPPAYTRLAPVFPLLGAPAPEPGGDAAQPPGISVPEGSVLTATVTGGDGDATLEFGGAATPFAAPEPGNRRATMTVAGSGLLTVRLDGDALAAWDVRAIADAPPRVAFTEPPKPSGRGTLRIRYKGADDYGVAALRGEVRRTYERGAVVGKEVSAFELAVPHGGAGEFEESIFQDFAPHPWAGLPVVIRLVAEDAAGQETVSDPVTLILPERQFTKPVAKRIIAERRRLTTAPERRTETVEGLGEIASRPGAFNHDKVIFMGLSFSRSRLVHEPAHSAVPPVRDLLWDTALRAEDGRLSLSERDLLRAQNALRDALARNAPPEELRRLMNELRRAMNAYLRELARNLANLMPDQQAMPADPGRVTRARDLQDMLRQIERMMRSGARDAAARMLAELRHMLENLRNARLMPMTPDGRLGGQSLRELQDLVRRQGELMDRTFRLSRQGRDGRAGGREAQEQRALREALDRIRRRLQRQLQRGGPAQGALDQAGQAMENAIRALEQGRPGAAVGPQGQAIEALRRAGRGLMQEMRNRMAGQRGPGLGFGMFDPLDTMRDPLGRDWQEGQGGEDVRRVGIPDEGQMKRAREILDELHKRAGQRHRAPEELDYINRLLERF